MLKLNRANLLQVYCLFKDNKKDGKIIYWQLVEIFGRGFTSRWERLFEVPLEAKEQEVKANNNLPRSPFEKYQKQLNAHHFSFQFASLDLMQNEREMIIRALKLTRYCQIEAAELLGISARSLNYKIHSLHKIKHESFRKNVDDIQTNELDMV